MFEPAIAQSPRRIKVNCANTGNGHKLNRKSVIINWGLLENLKQSDAEHFIINTICLIHGKYLKLISTKLWNTNFILINNEIEMNYNY